LSLSLDHATRGRNTKSIRNLKSRIARIVTIMVNARVCRLIFQTTLKGRMMKVTMSVQAAEKITFLETGIINPSTPSITNPIVMLTKNRRFSSTSILFNKNEMNRKAENDRMNAAISLTNTLSLPQRNAARIKAIASMFDGKNIFSIVFARVFFAMTIIGFLD